MLRHVVDVYHVWSERENPRDDDYPDEINVWFGDHDPEMSLALIMLAIANYDEVEFLGVVSAGLLEDVLSHHPATNGRALSNEMLERIVAEARRTPRFRWLLSGVWTYGSQPHVAAAIKEAVGDVRLEDPLPPRPWA